MLISKAEENRLRTHTRRCADNIKTDLLLGRDVTAWKRRQLAQEWDFTEGEIFLDYITDQELLDCCLQLVLNNTARMRIHTHAPINRVQTSTQSQPNRVTEQHEDEFCFMINARLKPSNQHANGAVFRPSRAVSISALCLNYPYSKNQRGNRPNCRIGRMAQFLNEHMLNPI